MSHPIPAPRRRRATASGFTLIEVLVALLVFSFGVLGAVALQAVAIQATTQNTDRSRAAMLANEMVSTLWANQSSTITGTPYTSWQSRVSSPTASGLPNGVGTVTACAGVANCAVIKITWRQPTAKASTTANKYETTVVIQ